MAVDPKDDDETDDGTELAAERKVRRARSLSKSQRTVETALDDFIARANEKILDVSGFDAAAREQQLQAEIAELKKKLADAESDEANTKTSVALPKAKAAAVEPERIVETRLKWAPVIGAFLLGCGAMFAINLATKPDAPPTQTAAPTPPVAAQPGSPNTAATATPIAEPPTPPAPTTTTPTTPETPAQVTQLPTPKQPKQPKLPKQTATTTPATTTSETTPPPATTPPKATPQQGSGSGELYNPF